MLHVSHLALLVIGVCAWLAQLVLKLLWIYQNATAESSLPWLLKLSLIVDLLAGAVLVVLLVRALYWHPRSKAQVASALRKERMRIARDLHDQVGSQIVNAMLLFDSPANKTHPLMLTLEQCMLDLRLLVDVMSDHKGNLAERLGSLRHRLQPVLDQRGIRLKWSMEVDRIEELPKGSRARELCRIVQEAVSNVLQHSRATALSIELRPSDEGQPGQWLLSVIDNGVGMKPAQRSGYGGKGLANMRRRAMRAQSALKISSNENAGTRVLVIVKTRDFEPTVSAAFGPND